MKPLHLLSVQILFSHPCLAILFPRDSTSRESKSLDGLWRFKLSPKDDPDIGFRESWFSAPLQVFVDRRLAASMSVAGRGCVAYAGAKQLQWHHHRQRSEKNLNPIFLASFCILRFETSLVGLGMTTISTHPLGGRRRGWSSGSHLQSSQTLVKLWLAPPTLRAFAMTIWMGPNLNIHTHHSH